MPAIAEREKDLWCLWASNGSDWSLMDKGPERQPLELKAKSLQTLFTNRRFAVVYGPDKPGRRL
jgi:hypothetical protein